MRATTRSSPRSSTSSRRKNRLKWENVHPQPDKNDSTLADQDVAFGERHHMFILGHNLAWHSETPAWASHDDKGNLLTRDALLARTRDHIHTVVGPTKAASRPGMSSMKHQRRRHDAGVTLVEDHRADYIQKAFEYAHEADPAAKLNYNDYNIEYEAKRNGAVTLIKQLQAAGIPVATVGIQEHVSLDTPTLDQLNDSIDAFAKLGVKVAITELDVDVLPRATRQQTADVSVRAAQDPALNPYANRPARLCPAAVNQAIRRSLRRLSQTSRRREPRHALGPHRRRLLAQRLAHQRSHHRNPLLFDRAGHPKPAFNAVISVASGQ